jgi:hypothetical protein
LVNPVQYHEDYSCEVVVSASKNKLEHGVVTKLRIVATQRRSHPTRNAGLPMFCQYAFHFLAVLVAHGESVQSAG